MTSGEPPVGLVSIIIPARNESGRIGITVRAARQSPPPGIRVEVIVVDDGSTDDTRAEAESAGARVLQRQEGPRDAGSLGRGNPAAARNAGAAAAGGDPLIFLDADCVPRADWLARLLGAGGHGCEVVGGSVELPAGLPRTARADHYASAYHVHPRRSAGTVPNHPPCNLSVRREAFARSGGFWERHPAADGHEELAWQHELRRTGGCIHFAPDAIVEHYHRAGWGNLLRRSYRWAYSAVEAKATWGTVRFAWLYRSRWLLALLSLPLAVVSTFYILGCWWRAGRFAATLYLPAILASRFAYAFGMLAGGLRWMTDTATTPHEHRPRWG